MSTKKIDLTKGIIGCWKVLEPAETLIVNNYYMTRWLVECLRCRGKFIAYTRNLTRTGGKFRNCELCRVNKYNNRKWEFARVDGKVDRKKRIYLNNK